MTRHKPNYLELNAEEMAAVERAKSRAASSRLVIAREHYALAELGYYFGWQAIRDVIDDYITFDDAMLLVVGARELRKDEVIDHAAATLAATSPVKGTYEKLMKPYVSTASIE